MVYDAAGATVSCSLTRNKNSFVDISSAQPDGNDDNKSPEPVESADIGGGRNRFIKELWRCMSPQRCFSPDFADVDNMVLPTCRNPLADGDDNIDFNESTVPALLSDVRNNKRQRSAALQRIYRMTDKSRSHNRIPFVCTNKFDVFEPLVTCLRSEVAANDRRQALLILNNLSIPPENKAVIILGDSYDVVMPALMGVLRERLPECYLAASCLFNLSFLDEAKSMILTYRSKQPRKGGQLFQQNYHHYVPEDDPDSLLRIIEVLMQEYTPIYVTSQRSSSRRQQQTSVQEEAMRWSMAMLRKLVSDAKNKENALLVVQRTTIHLQAAECLAGSNKDLSLWTNGSLEDNCLMLLVHLACCGDECARPLNNKQTRQALQQLRGKGGIHDTRASVLLKVLDEFQSISCKTGL